MAASRAASTPGSSWGWQSGLRWLWLGEEFVGTRFEVVELAPEGCQALPAQVAHLRDEPLGVPGGDRELEALGEPPDGSLVVAGGAVLEAGVVVEPDVGGGICLDLGEDRMRLFGATGSKQDLCQAASGIRCAGVAGVDRGLHRVECVVGAAEALVGLGELAEELGEVEDARCGLRPAAACVHRLLERCGKTDGVLGPARRCLLELAFGLEHLHKGSARRAVSALKSSSLGHPATVGARRAVVGAQDSCAACSWSSRARRRARAALVRGPRA